MRFATASLSVGETRGHASLKDRLHQRLGRVLVDQLVVASVVERIIEPEVVIFQVFGQIHLGSRLMHDERVL